MQALVFDLGGTHLRSGLVDAGGAVTHVAKTRVSSFANGTAQRDVWDGVRSAILDYERQHRCAVPAPAPLVVAFPGPVSFNRTIVNAPTLTGPDATPPDLAAELEVATGRRVLLLNDVSAAAWHFAASCTAARFMVVTVSSGIGSKIVDRSHPAVVLDDTAYAGEIGHCVVDDSANAPICECGGAGHLGAIASGRGIERAVRRQAILDPEGFRRSAFGAQVAAEQLLNERHILPAALAGDVWTLDVIRECTRPLSRTLVAIYVGAGLERIFLIGGFAQALGETYLNIVISQMTGMSGHASGGRSLAPVVRIVAPDDEVCLHGCASFLRLSHWMGSAFDRVADQLPLIARAPGIPGPRVVTPADTISLGAM